MHTIIGPQYNAELYALVSQMLTSVDDKFIPDSIW